MTEPRLQAILLCRRIVSTSRQSSGGFTVPGLPEPVRLDSAIGAADQERFACGQGHTWRLTLEREGDLGVEVQLEGTTMTRFRVPILYSDDPGRVFPSWAIREAH